MTRNPVLDELHATRRKILSGYNGDTAEYLRDAQKRLESSGRPIWRGKQRTIKPLTSSPVGRGGVAGGGSDKG